MGALALVAVISGASPSKGITPQVPAQRVRSEVERSELSERLQAMLDHLVEEESNVRNAVLLVEGPGFRWKGASGIAFADSGLAMLPDDQFNLDSIVKMMTATIVMKLGEEGLLGLDDPIAEHLPDSVTAGLHVYEGRSYGERITVRQLLNHSSGLADNWGNPAFLDLILAAPERHWTPIETIEFLKESCPPAFPPGGGFKYSDPGYNLLGLIIERRTGEPLHAVFRNRLLEPLGMGHTYRPSHEEPRPSIPGRGPAERYLEDMECTLVPAVLTADWAGGGMISTTEDLNRFLRSFVRDEIFEDPSTRSEMFQWIDSGPYHNYGFGISRVLFDESEDPDHAGLGEIWGHAGSSHSFMFYWPREDITIIGTLNQLACERSLYDTLALIMRTILDASSVSPKR